VSLFTKWRIGFDADEFDLRRSVRKIGDRPILFMAGGADVRMPPEIARTLYEASPSTHKNSWSFPTRRTARAFAPSAKCI
jgi:hypothetical protein